ncbi:DUF4373 domain-containing protein [Chitinophaga tropicalis]|nr:DUF4373 domain-containing protein [Chitinophaga tropicalis]
MECEHIRNTKVRLLYNEFQETGYWIWQCILSRSYEDKGYYFDCNDKDALELFASEVCKKRVSQVEEVIRGCVRRSLFDKGVYDMFNVLTSAEMQEVYLDATAERRRKGTIIEMVPGYLLITRDENDLKRWENIHLTGEKTILPRNNSINPRNNKENPRHNLQSKVKEIEEEKTIAETPVLPPVPPAVVSLDPGKDLQKEYEQLEKTKEDIFHFIRQYHPEFIQPYADFWNFFASKHSLPKITAISKKRKQHFSVRIKEKDFDFPNILRKAKTSDFLLTGSWFGFDWLIKNDSNYLKVLEGNYDNKKTEGQNNAESATEEYLKKRAKLEEEARLRAQR